MSENNTITVPTWALPLIVSLAVALIGYGASQARADATKSEVERVGKVVEKIEQTSSQNEKAVALNAQAIKQIADSLDKQEEISKSSDAKLQQLIEITLEQR